MIAHLVARVRQRLHCLLQRESVMLFSVTTGLIIGVAGFLHGNDARARGPFPFQDPQASLRWELGPNGPELVISAVAHMTPGVQCDSRAILTRYWDVGGQLLVAWPETVKGRPSGPFYPIDGLREGQKGEVRFQADEVPEGARDYVTLLTAPIGACGDGGWWGAGESIRLAVPPRPDLRTRSLKHPENPGDEE